MSEEGKLANGNRVLGIAYVECPEGAEYFRKMLSEEGINLKTDILGLKVENESVHIEDFKPYDEDCRKFSEEEIDIRDMWKEFPEKELAGKYMAALQIAYQDAIEDGFTLKGNRENTYENE
ncbi:MAG: hypothetical protein ACLFQ8_01205 [Candidatus Aenigmatarchaeota archaeon]